MPRNNQLIERIRKKPIQLFVSTEKRKRPRNQHSKTEQASIFLINYRGRPAIFRWHASELPSHNKSNAMARYYSHKIAHELFPDYTPRVLGVKQINVTLPDRTQRVVWGIVTDIIHGRSRDYKEYHEHFYEKPSVTPPPAHEAFVKANNKVTFALEAAGICPMIDPINIINSHGKPIHIEISEVIPSKIKKYILKLPEKKRKIILELLEKYEPYRRFG